MHWRQEFKNMAEPATFVKLKTKRLVAAEPNNFLSIQVKTPTGMALNLPANLGIEKIVALIRALGGIDA